MSARTQFARLLLGGGASAIVGAAVLAPIGASADGLLIPGLGPDPSLGRPSYRESYNDYPPPQHNILGLPKRTPRPSDRPSYRETVNAFPPAGGRYGGGFIEYVMTGGRPEPIPASAYPAPAYAQPAYAQPYTASDYNAVVPANEPVVGRAANPVRASLPKGGLPDYSAQVMGAGPAGGGAQSAYAQAAYAQPASSQPGLPDLGLGQIFGQPSAAQATYNEPGSPYDPPTATAAAASRPMDPVYGKQMVAYSGRERAGTVIIDTPQKFLYLVQGNGQAIRYGIGVGRPGFTWAGVKSISRKAEWPGWTPPGEMLKRRPDLPRHMEGGIGNPLGARALYLGSSMYRIHGTNEPYTIGTNVSSGCIRMMNQDVIDLYGRVGVGTRVVVL